MALKIKLFTWWWKKQIDPGWEVEHVHSIRTARLKYKTGRKMTVTFLSWY